MKLSRNFTLKIHFIFDQLVPPIIRDQKWFMHIPIRIMYGNKYKHFFDFHKRFLTMTDEDMTKLYDETSCVLLRRETDLNKGCIKKILKSVKGKKVLDVACGNGYLSDLLSKRYDVTATDIVQQDSVKKNKKIKFVESNFEKELPFKKEEFDTVICTHALEHVKNFEKAIYELRKICKKRLIIVVPKQRPYKYNFDFHIQFFPYVHTLMMRMGKPKNKNKCEVIEGDLFYIEDN